MPNSKCKRPYEDVDNNRTHVKQKCRSMCIIHIEGIVPGKFIYIKDLPDPKDKFQKLCTIRDKRLLAPSSSKQRMESSCESIPNALEDHHGYHRACYQRFTMNLDRIGSSSIESYQEKPPLRRSLRKKDAVWTLSKKCCLFCDKDERIRVKSGGSWKWQSTKIFDHKSGQKILDIAKQSDDVQLLCKINGKDLFVCEARYHSVCRKKYTADPRHWRSKDSESIGIQNDLETAHTKAFEFVIKYVADSVISRRQVVQLSHLRLIYVSELKGSDYENPFYRSQKLKKKLQNHPDVGPKIEFSLVEPQDNTYLPFHLVFNKEISVAEALNYAYQPDSKDHVKDVAMMLRGAILCSYEKSKENTNKWPPDPCDLEVCDDVIPPLLKRFLNLMLSEHEGPQSSRALRILFSVGQDICRGVTNGEWKLPKHILLCVTLRHLYRSKHLITLLNRLGHCENNTFAAEVESAIASSLDETSSLLTNQISRGPSNIIFHSEWDNFNQFLSGHGKPMCNAAGGIMMQEVSGNTNELNNNSIVAPVLSVSKSKNPCTDGPLPDFHIVKKGPVMDVKVKIEPNENIAAYKEALQMYMLWKICRFICGKGKQQVPAFAGFISKTGQSPKKLTTIDYYPMINEPITEYKVVKEILDRCARATEEVGQKYTVITFDLGVIMKAMPIIWNKPNDYREHIILIGAFHTIMNYLNMIGHKMAGSGYSEIIIEANLVTTGCLKGVLSGKSYAKSLRCLKVVSECFERLLFSTFIDQLPADSQLRTACAGKIDALIQCCNQKVLITALEDHSVIGLLQAYEDFQDKVRKGHLGKTATFWLSFLDHARRVFLLICACKTNNLPLFQKCMSDMADLFFSFGGHNYARFLSWFDVYLTNIEASHPGATKLLEKGAISVARSFIPGNLCMCDKTMEETFMKFSKSKGGAGGTGITGLLTNYEAYQRWIRTTSERTKFYQSTLAMCGLSDDSDSSNTTVHHENFPADIERSEVLVNRTINAVTGFLNPFEIADKSHLYVLSSGSPVSADIERDVLRSESAGHAEKEKFVQKRLYEKTQMFYDKITKLNLLTMEKRNKKVKLTSTQGKTIQYQEQGDIAFQLLVKSQMCPNPVSIEELMAYSLTPVPHSLGTADGFMAKTCKSKILAYLTAEVSSVDGFYLRDEKVLYIEDGNARLHALKEIPDTFEQICLKLLDQLPRNSDVLFSTDMYKDGSVKSQERLRRGSSERLLLEGIKMRRPSDFKLFLQNDDNKTQLFKVMKRVWTSNAASQRLEKRTVMLVVEGCVYSLQSKDGLSCHHEEIIALKSDQEETDTRVILYVLYAQTEGYDRVVVRSPDSDILFILLYYAHTFHISVFLDTGRSDKRQMLDITEMAKDLGKRYCESLLGLYVFTGEDANCAFKGKGKVNPLKKLLKKPRFHDSFCRLGEKWEVATSLVDDLEEFVCFMYGYPRLKSVNEVRAVMLKKMVGKSEKITVSSKVDLSKLPPCKNSLLPHIKRVNHRVGQWKRSHEKIPDIPFPTKHGWRLVDEFLEPVWSEGPILPNKLIDILVHDEVEFSSNENSDEEEVEIDFSSDEDSDTE